MDGSAEAAPRSGIDEGYGMTISWPDAAIEHYLFVGLPLAGVQLQPEPELATGRERRAFCQRNGGAPSTHRSAKTLSSAFAALATSSRIGSTRKSMLGGTPLREHSPAPSLLR
jgi:hypothetical protein